MKCPNCENSIENNSVTCEWCGINLQTFEAEKEAKVERLAKEKELQKEEINFISQQTQRQEISDETSEKSDLKPKRFKYKKIILLGVVGLIVIVGLCFAIDSGASAKE
jgi:hypothetical protein